MANNNDESSLLLLSFLVGLVLGFIVTKCWKKDKEDSFTPNLATQSAKYDGSTEVTWGEEAPYKIDQSLFNDQNLY